MAISGEYDVVVVGAGNAGMCAALAARESGARVLVLEAAPFDERGGNSRYTAGALRFVYNGVDDLLKLCDLSEQELATSRFRHLHAGQVLRRSRPADRLSQQPRHGRAADHEEPGDAVVDARARASASRRCIRARPSSTRASSCSGAGWRWRPGAAGRGSSRGCSTRRKERHRRRLRGARREADRRR